MGNTYRRDVVFGKEIRDGEKVEKSYHKEISAVRIHNRRSVRKNSRQALRQGDYDNLPGYVKTGGWESN